MPTIRLRNDGRSFDAGIPGLPVITNDPIVVTAEQFTAIDAALDDWNDSLGNSKVRLIIDILDPDTGYVSGEVNAYPGVIEFNIDGDLNITPVGEEGDEIRVLILQDPTGGHTVTVTDVPIGVVDESPGGTTIFDLVRWPLGWVYRSATAATVGTVDIAEAFGFWPVYSVDPPATTTMFGVPVAWIDPGDPLTPVPVNPPSPTWNDDTSEFTIPSGVVGVDYVWTSGGGGIGLTVAQGATVGTTGAFPRNVVITPIARPGYVLATEINFTHPFPDPSSIIVWTSDGFSGAADTDLVGRATDIALGGTAKIPTGTVGSFALDGAGHAKRVAGVNSNSAKYLTTSHNLKLEFDLVSITTATEEDFSTLVGLVRDDGEGLSPLVLMGDDRTWILANNNSGGNTTLQSGFGIPSVAGHWIFQLYQRVFTLTPPSGVPQVFDLSNQVTYKAETGTELIGVSFIHNGSAGDTFVFDNLKISTIGF